MEVMTVGKYFGSTLNRKELNGIMMIEKNHNSGESLPVHAHENAYFCTILEGNWQKRIGDIKIDCIPQKCIYHNPFEEHSDLFLNKSRVFDIEIRNSTIESLIGNSSEHPNYKIYFNDRVNWLNAHIYYEFIMNGNDSDLLFEELLINLLSITVKNEIKFKKEKKIPCWLTGVKDYIDDNFSESICFNNLARQADVHPVHLVRSFKSAFNCNLGEYQRIARVKDACQKLIYTNLTLTEIANVTGFFDQSHFYRIFRKYTGMLPASYRSVFIPR